MCFSASASFSSANELLCSHIRNISLKFYETQTTTGLGFKFIAKYI